MRSNAFGAGIFMGQEWPKPQWLDELPVEQQEAALTRFYLDLAALYATPRGSMKGFCRKLGLHELHICNVVTTGRRLSLPITVKIETLLGRDLFRRELFRPDLYPQD